MSGIDIVLGLLILIGAYHGYKAGFLLELFSLVAIVLGVLAGFKFMGWAMVVLGEKVNVNKNVLPYVAFAAVFIAVVIVVNLLGRLVKASVDKSFLGPVDEVGGAVVGLLRTTFVFSIALWIVDSLKLSFMSEWTEDSWLYPMVAGIAPKFTHWISGFFPFFKDVF
ncbi:MAG TPA: CvpA family protein [Chryseolinea sp.]|nr:CvpA family protein [Chryseolinea sp.]